jgi:hypothetical protein
MASISEEEEKVLLYGNAPFRMKIGRRVYIFISPWMKPRFMAVSYENLANGIDFHPFHV